MVVMADFHHNIFYCYRGAHQQEREKERQLEDNVTKALINTLQHANGRIRKEFLKWLDISIHADDRVRFVLQRPSIGEKRIAKKKRRVLLALLPDRGDFQPDGNVPDASNYDSRPDAWIYGDDFVVLIESKVVGCIDAKQMNSHYRKLIRDGDPEPIYIEQRWADVHRLFLRIGHGVNGVNAWLVDQFTEFLEYNSMADFTGFTTEFFDYFFTRDDDDVRKWVRASFAEFAQKVQTVLARIDSFYETADVGQLKVSDRHAWAAFGPGPGHEAKRYRNLAHLTLTVDSQGIGVKANIELKSATDRLKEKIRTQPERFRRLFLEFHKDGAFQVKIEERVQRQASIYDYHPVADIASSYLADKRTGDKTMDFVVALLTEIPLPYFMAERQIGRIRAIGLSGENEGDALLEEIVAIMKSFHPLVAFVNE